MTLVFSNQGEVMVLTAALAVNYTLRLYTNNKAPANADTEADYTEAAGNGYASKVLNGGTWTIVGGSPSTATYPALQSFAFSGALGNVYGYYLTRVSDGKLLYAERFTGAPFNIQNNGDKIEFTPAITGASVSGD